MAIDPRRALQAATVLRTVYEQAEATMLAAVARRLARGITQPGWAEAKLAEVSALRLELAALVARLERATPDQVAGLLEEAHRAGVTAAARRLGGPTLVRTGREAVEALARAQLGQLQQLHFPILRTGLDAYRAAVAEASSGTVTGVLTRRQAAAGAMRRFADAGVSGFVDRAGRSWDLASYAEMSTRSAVGQAHLQGHVDELRGRGHDLVIVSDSPDECRLCRPWEGRVLSISGTDPRHPALASARADGLFHANCTHSLGAFIAGLTQRFSSTANPLGEAERARQRELERQIRTWKRRELVAAPLDPQAARAAARHVAERQAAMRDFIADSGRRRDYVREAAGAAR